MIDKGQWREFGQDTGVTPYSLREVLWDFLMTTESQDLGLMSHPKDNVKEKYNCRVFLLSTLICKCLSSILSTK